MEAKSVNQDMGSASVPKLMLNLAIPAVIAQLINMLYNIVDRIYIGRTLLADFDDDKCVCDARRLRRSTAGGDFHGKK